MNRDDFLARIRQAAEAGRTYRVATRPGLTRDAGRAAVPDDLVAEYVREASGAGGRVERVADWDAARAVLRQHFIRYEPRIALCWRHPVLDKLHLDKLLESSGIERVDAASLDGLDREAQRAKILSADIGITSTTWAVAETGSLFCAHGHDTERVASLAPPVYFAVIEREQIVADLFDAFDRVEAKYGPNVPSNLTFITGPSKTGDIETKMVTGVHGPGKWHIVVIG